MLSNEDLFQMKNTIMSDIQKGNQRKNSQTTQLIEESKQSEEQDQYDNEYPHSNSNKEYYTEEENDEEDIENIGLGLPLSGNIFHPYIDKNNCQKRYNDKDQSDEEEIVMW